MSSAIIVFAKVPDAGTVKTRLMPALEASEAADLYAAFLRDGLEQYVQLDVDVRLYMAPSDAELDLSTLPAAVSLHKQAGQDLGERMARAFVETFAAGYERVVILGTDHPTLPSAFIEIGIEALSNGRSVAIGPAEDGGYYLLGMNDFIPELFRGMEYSHGDVFKHTLDRVPDSGVELTVLPEWYDVDTPDDVMRLAAELGSEGGTGGHTRHVLMRLSRRHAWIQSKEMTSENNPGVAGAL